MTYFSTVRFVGATALAFLSGLPAFADVIAAPSAITGATVFPQGASVTRAVAFTAGAGQHSIVIDDLPMQFDPSTLRVTGTGDVAFRIVSVDHRITRLPPRDVSDSPEYVAIEAEIEALRGQVSEMLFARSQSYAQVQVAEGRLRMVEALMMREPQGMVNEVDQGSDPATWGQTIAVLAEQMELALLAKLSAEQEIMPLDVRLAELRVEIVERERALAASQLPAVDRSVATVEIAVEGDVEGALELTYRVGSAGWQPVYDLRLEQGGEATLEVERHARIWQATGEDWDSVALTLSTARTSAQMSAPHVGEQVAVLWTPGAPEFFDDRMQTRLEAAPQAFDGMIGVALNTPEAPVVVAGLTQSEVVMQGQTVTYVLPALADVDGDGTVRQAAIDTARLAVEPTARSAPRLDPNAYLYAQLVNDFGGPILPGQASVYVDGAFVGSTLVPLVAAGAEVDLPFGVLDGIAISSDVADRESGDYGILSTTNTRREGYRLSAQSLLAYDMEVTIYDRAPVSEDEDLEIETTASIDPTEQDVDGNRGVVAWTVDLAAGAEWEVAFGYTLWWPGEETLLLQ